MYMKGERSVNDIDAIIDDLIGYRMTKMSMSWSEISQELRSQVTQKVLEYLVRIYLFRTDKRVEHEKDVYRLYHDIARLKSNNAYPPQDKIFRTIWNTSEASFNSIQSHINNECKGSISIDRECIEFCKDYMQWLSMILSREGRVDEFEVLDKIDELLR